VNPLPNEDPEKVYQLAERRLRELLFGDGAYTPGLVKGEDRRIELTRVLQRMRQSFDAASSHHERVLAEIAEARIAELEEELRKVAAARTRDPSRRH
jgi:hypothetical protein